MAMNKTKAIGLSVIVAVSGSFLAADAAMAAKKQIKWWMGNAGGITTWTAIKKMYEKEHKNVEVTLIQGELDKFYTMVTAGLMPDIWGPWSNPGIRADVNRNWAVELTPYIQRDGKGMNINDFFPGLMREFRINGKQYSLPVFNYQDYFYYNTELYKQAGLTPPPIDSNDKTWNWDRFVLNAQKITKLDANSKVTVAGADVYRELTWNPGYMSIWGAFPYSEKALKTSVPQQIDWDSKEMVTALTKAHDLVYKQRVATPGGGGFATGKAGQLIDVGWRIGDFMLAKKLKWAIANNPWGETNKGAMWPDGWRMSKVCKNKDLVWDFMKFLCSPKVMAYLTSDTKGPFQASAVARKSVFNETLAENIGKATGMKPADVLRITEQADDVNIVKYQETICLHVDLSQKFLEPIMKDFGPTSFHPSRPPRSCRTRQTAGFPSSSGAGSGTSSSQEQSR